MTVSHRKGAREGVLFDRAEYRRNFCFGEGEIKSICRQHANNNKARLRCVLFSSVLLGNQISTLGTNEYRIFYSIHEREGLATAAATSCTSRRGGTAHRLHYSTHIGSIEQRKQAGERKQHGATEFAHRGERNCEYCMRHHICGTRCKDMEELAGTSISRAFRSER